MARIAINANGAARPGPTLTHTVDLARRVNVSCRLAKGRWLGKSGRFGRCGDPRV